MFSLSLFTTARSPNRTNLLRLALIRFIVLIGQLVAIYYASNVLNATLNYPILLGTVALMMAINTLTLWRITQSKPVSELEIFFQLLIDVAALSSQLYFSGGATNPFVSYFLVPIAIAAALLPARYTWLITSLSLISYTSLLFYFQPLAELMPNSAAPSTIDPHAHHMASAVNSGMSWDVLNLHIVGMWLNFSISASLIAFYLVRMANTVQEQRDQLDQQREQINRQREQDLRNQQILGLATLAAGTAHELGTPLNTIKLLLDELDSSPDPQDIELLKQQVAQCKQIIGQLARTAELHQLEQPQINRLADFLQQTVSNWQLLRPQAHYTLNIKTSALAGDTQYSPSILVDTTVSQAINNLLNNAADAATEQTIAITADWDASFCTINIRDYGKGFDAAIAEKLGQPFISDKKSGAGMGLGIYLSQSTIERFGGNITLNNHPDGGAIVSIQLPIAGVTNDI